VIVYQNRAIFSLIISFSENWSQNIVIFPKKSSENPKLQFLQQNSCTNRTYLTILERAWSANL
jgi:hypothetical protein